tara:strand:+ start:322 stop:483 length:162 start_codon:yes stop_codon:yes gene_type:complete
MRIYYKDGGAISKKLAEHSKHHSAKHMKAMKQDMKDGDSFSKSHKSAMKKIGK